MKKFSLRVNGTRIGDAARPASLGSAGTESPADLSVQATHRVAAHRLPTRRAIAPLRVNVSPAQGLVVRDYRDGTDDA